MNFVSIEFIILFILVFFACCIATHRIQNAVLLCASLVFYGWWDWRFLLLMLGVGVVDYTVAIILDNIDSHHEANRKIVLSISIAANISLLCFFKYYNFFAENLSLLFSNLGFSIRVDTLSIILPIGISFYTFENMSYTIDVYRRHIKATRHIFDYMLFVTFFPQLMAGPIQRANHILPQILKPRALAKDNMLSGAMLTLYGYYKKIVIADNLGLIVDYLFSDASTSGSGYVLGSYAFAFQIYCDFSGYTDIARGTARMIGFDLSENFRLPYLVSNVRAFWRSWHMSLSTWLRDYLYFPLGGSRNGPWRTIRNLMIVMTLCGLWHGASWHFVAWGVYFGVLIVIYNISRETGLAAFAAARLEDSRIFRLAATVVFFHLVCLGWLLFRAESMSQVSLALQRIVFHFQFGEKEIYLLLKFLFIVSPLVCFELYLSSSDLEPWKRWNWPSRWVFAAASLACIVLLAPPQRSPFIYFQF